MSKKLYGSAARKSKRRLIAPHAQSLRLLSSGRTVADERWSREAFFSAKYFAEGNTARAGAFCNEVADVSFLF